MIITDGTTELTFTVAGNNGFDNELDISRVRASAGAWRSSVAGERAIVTEFIVVDGDELRALFNLLNSSFTQLYYTPDDIPDEMNTADFPLPVNIVYKGKKKRWYNGEIQSVIELDIESTNFI